MKEFLNARFISAVGVPSIIALYLVYYLTTGVSVAHDNINAKIDSMKDYFWVNCHTLAEIAKSQKAHDRCDEVREGRSPRTW